MYVKKYRLLDWCVRLRMCSRDGGIVYKKSIYLSKILIVGKTSIEINIILPCNIFSFEIKI
jgi:hypothetical protein